MSQISAGYVCDVGDDSSLSTIIHLNLHLASVTHLVYSLYDCYYCSMSRRVCRQNTDLPAMIAEKYSFILREKMAEHKTQRVGEEFRSSLNEDVKQSHP